MAIEDLYKLVREYADAQEAFIHHPEAVLSSPPSPEFAKISDRFFGLRDKLEEEGLKFRGFGHTTGDRLPPLVLRWAVWTQAAHYTSTLTLSCLGSSDDCSTIMAMLGRAEAEMIEHLEEKWTATT